MRFRCLPEQMKPYVIIVDWKFYADNSEEIEAWASKCTPGWKLHGPILEFNSEEDRLAFLLRWD